MYILHLGYFKSSESQNPDEHFEFDYLKGRTLDFAEIYNLQEDVFCGEVDYRRETNIEEVKKWLKDGIINYHMEEEYGEDRVNAERVCFE